MRRAETRSARLLSAPVLLVAVALCPAPAQAHRDDYIDETLVYLTLGRGEVEVEYWFDLGRHVEPRTDFRRHNVASEWGITDHWMADARATVIDREGQKAQLDSWRLETRCRFQDEGDWPVDVAASLEVNSEREAAGSSEVGLEPRLILSRDIAEELNLTANLSTEVPLEGEPASFLTALGVRCDATGIARFGSELHYNLRADSGSAIPQVWFDLAPGAVLKLGYSIGLGREPVDFARAALEVEF